MVSEYILADRTTADKWSITIDDGELLFSTTASDAQAEPIFEDDVNPGSYYRLFISDGELVIEDTVTVQDDVIILEDVTGNVAWKLIVDDGGIAYINVVEEVLVSRLIVRANSSANLVSKITVRAFSGKGILFIVYVTPAVENDFIVHSRVFPSVLMNSLAADSTRVVEIYSATKGSIVINSLIKM